MNIFTIFSMAGSRMHQMRKSCIRIPLLLVGLLFSINVLADSKWTTDSYDRTGSNHAKSEKMITPDNVDKLIVKWSAETSAELAPPNQFGDVEMKPLVVDGITYYGDAAGNVYARHVHDGSLIWHKNAGLDYSTPGHEIFSIKHMLVKGDKLIIASSLPFGRTVCPQLSTTLGTCVNSSGAVIVAVDRHTGNVLWRTNVDNHPAAKVRGGMVTHGSTLYVPVSSWEEDFTATSSDQVFGGSGFSKYPCCTFRGSVAALNLNTGDILWQTYTTPAADEYPAGILEPGESATVGAAVWGGLSLDTKRKHVYLGTGNNYAGVKKMIQCEKHRLNNANPAPTLPAGITCDNINEKLGNNFNSVIALDMKTGEEKWVHRSINYDAWVHACAQPDFYMAMLTPGILLNNSQNGINNLLNCPNINGSFFPGPDYGFGHAPMVMNNVKMPDGSKRDMVVTGNKDGAVYVLDADTGEAIYPKVNTGHGGITGGIMYGMANDGKTIYGINTQSSSMSRDTHLPFISNLIYFDPDIPLEWKHPAPAPGILTDLLAAFFGPASGPKTPHVLVNPPAQAKANADGVSTFYDSNTDTLTTITSYAFAIDAATGTVLWESPYPTDGRPPANYNIAIPGVGAFGSAPSGGGAGIGSGGVTLANDILIAGSTLGDGALLFFDTHDGSIINEFNAEVLGTHGGGVMGASIANGHVFVGAGTSIGFGFFGFPPVLTGGLGLPNNKIYVLCLDEDGNNICDEDE